ncbi:MAG: hypothetical protein V7K69_07830, partial [Nostoc sp.]|uniref:hypothetical protein n=1 Tax=Nostoc sp. TaxID=1180 RepID=UPI002FF5EB0F
TAINQVGKIDPQEWLKEHPRPKYLKLSPRKKSKEDSFNPELTAINQVGKIDPQEWLKEHPRPKYLKLSPRKKSNQTSEPDQNIISSQPGRTKGMNEFLKVLKNKDTLKEYQQLEQLTDKGALKKVGIMPLGSGSFGTVYAYKKVKSLDTDPVTHVIKVENPGGPGERDYDERKPERKRAVFIPLVAHELGFTHMPLATSMPQESQVDSREKKRNNLLSTLASGEAGRTKMLIASDSSYAYGLVDKEFNNKFVVDNISDQEIDKLKEKFGFKEKVEKAEQELTFEKKVKELDIDEQQIQDAVILDMLFQYKDGSYTQYMFDQGNLKKIDNDDYGIAKVNRNQTGEYSSSFPVGLPNANKLLTDDTKKRILNMDAGHLKKVLKAATYKDKSGTNPEKQQVFDEEKALRNLEDIQFLIHKADKYGGISLRELFDLYNARDEDDVLAPERSKKKAEIYESKIKAMIKKDKVLPSQLYNILGVAFPEIRADLFNTNIEVHKELGKIDEQRQQELEEKRSKLGHTPSIKDNPEFIKDIKKRSTTHRSERQKANYLSKLKALDVKELNKLIHILSGQLGSFEQIVSLPQSVLKINDPEQIEGSEHKFSQIKNWKTRKIKGKVRDKVRKQIATDKANKSGYLDDAEKEVLTIQHDRIKSKAMYPVQVAHLNKLINDKQVALQESTSKISGYINAIVFIARDLKVPLSPADKRNAIGKSYLDIKKKLAKLEADINVLETDINASIEQLENAVNDVLKHQEYPKVFGKDNIFEKDISSLKEAFQSYQKVARKLTSPK